MCTPKESIVGRELYTVPSLQPSIKTSYEKRQWIATLVKMYSTAIVVVYLRIKWLRVISCRRDNVRTHYSSCWVLQSKLDNSKDQFWRAECFQGNSPNTICPFKSRTRIGNNTKANGRFLSSLLYWLQKYVDIFRRYLR